MPGSKHGATLVYAVIDDEVVVVFREEMFGLQMHPSFLRSRADFVTILNEASILTLSSVRFSCIVVDLTHSFLLFSFSRCYQRIMIFADVKAQKVLRGEVLATFGATVGVYLSVVHLEFLKRGECDGLGMGS